MFTQDDYINEIETARALLFSVVSDDSERCNGAGPDNNWSDDVLICGKYRLLRLFRSYPGIYLHRHDAFVLQHRRWYHPGTHQLRPHQSHLRKSPQTLMGPGDHHRHLCAEVFYIKTVVVGNYNGFY